MSVIFDQAMLLAKNNSFKEAVKLLNNTIEEELENKGEALFELAVFFMNFQMTEDALDILIECYNIEYKKEKVLDIILDVYYKPNIDELKKNYQKNITLLKSYKYIQIKNFPLFEELNYAFIPYSETKFIIFDKKTKSFSKVIDHGINYYDLNQFETNEIVLINEETNSENIRVCLERTNDPTLFMMKIPLYLLYESKDSFLEYLQLLELETVLKTERVVILFGLSDCKNWFENRQTLIPSKALFNNKDMTIVMNYLNDLMGHRSSMMQYHYKSIQYHYDNMSKQELSINIAAKKPKILFVTSRFTTILQYFTRDCIEACNQLDISTELLIEQEDIFRVNTLEWLYQIDTYKPDIIFCIDHFRWEFEFLSKKIPFVTWILDVLPHIMSYESAQKITEFDFVLNGMPDSKELDQFNYPKSQLMDGIVRTNPRLYKTYDLTLEERTKYASDICIFSNSGNPEFGLKACLKELKSECISAFNNLEFYNIAERIYKKLYSKIYKNSYNGIFIFDLKTYVEMMKHDLKAAGISFSNQRDLERLANIFMIKVGSRILRSVPIEWLFDNNFQVKIWGAEWIDHPKLKGCAQGVAENGETLSKIINSSKLVLGTNWYGTAHPRVFETLFSNTLYIGPDIPEEYDIVNIRKYMKEDEEIILYKDCKDLISKVDYYLNNDAARKKAVELGRKKALEFFTYEALIKKLLDEVSNRLKGDWGQSNI